MTKDDTDEDHELIEFIRKHKEEYLELSEKDPDLGPVIQRMIRAIEEDEEEEQ